MHEFSEYSQSLTKKILNEMILFKNIINIENKYISWLVNNIKLDDICIALYHSNMLFQEKFIKNMSKDDAIYLKNYLSKKKKNVIKNFNREVTKSYTKKSKVYFR